MYGETTTVIKLYVGIALLTSQIENTGFYFPGHKWPRTQDIFRDPGRTPSLHLDTGNFGLEVSGEGGFFVFPVPLVLTGAT